MSLDRLTPLGVSVETVKTHLRTAMAHAGVSSRLQIALMAARQQI